MKKTLISLTLAASLLCAAGAPAYADHIGESPNESAAAQAETFIPGSVPAESYDMEGMIPPINAMVLCMLEQGLDYDENDDMFLWNSVYYMISLYGQMDSRAQLTDGELILPAETVEDYAASLFTNYEVLPQLPEELSDRVIYCAEEDTYYLARGDAGLSEIRIQEIERLPGAKSQVSGVLAALEDESAICTFTAVLMANESMFGYSISDLAIR